MAVWQFIQLCDVVAQTALSSTERDHHVWMPEHSGEFTSKSAYERFHVGGITFEPYKRLWKSWAPLKVKIFVWLASWRRCWMADRLARRGLPHPPACLLCDQGAKDINHILVSCAFTREVWYMTFRWLRVERLSPQPGETSFQDWWRRTSKRAGKEVRRGVNSLVILVAWLLWKYRNRCVFNGERPCAMKLLAEIKEEARLWAAAGAKRL